MDDLQLLMAKFDAVLQRLSASGRRALARQICTELRKTNAARIKANVQPDGSAMAPRSTKKQGRIKRRLMFKKLHRLQHLKASADANGATVSFTGYANRIARVSHYGLRDKVNNKGLMAKYPKRELLGVNDQDTAIITKLVTDYLETAL